RLKTVLGREPTAEQLAALAGRLSAERIGEFRDQSLLGKLSDIPADIAERRRQQRPAAGEWTHDPTTLTLRYQPTGHADPWLRAWLDVLAEGASGKQAKLFEPLLAQAMKPTAPGLCGSCHSIDRVDG